MLPEALELLENFEEKSDSLEKKLRSSLRVEVPRDAGRPVDQFWPRHDPGRQPGGRRPGGRGREEA